MVQQQRTRPGRGPVTAHRRGPGQRRALQRPRPVRRVQAVRLRPRARTVRDRGIPPDQSSPPVNPAAAASAYDAIVIGAGIIGCAVSLELGRAGRRVLCVDAGATAGSGSTGASSAIVRFHYSDATAILAAWDSYFDWIGWRDYLQLPAGEPLARYVQTGALVLDAPGSRRQATLDQFRRRGIEYEQLTATDIRRRFPEMSTQSFWPPKTPDEPAFWDDGHGEVGGYLTPAAGYVDDPQLAARNVMSAARRTGVTFLFGRRVRGVTTTRPGRRHQARHRGGHPQSGRGQRRRPGQRPPQPAGRRHRRHGGPRPPAAHRNPRDTSSPRLPDRAGRRLRHRCRPRRRLPAPRPGPAAHQQPGTRLRPARMDRRPVVLPQHANPARLRPADTARRQETAGAAHPSPAMRHRRPIRRHPRLAPHLRPQRPTRLLPGLRNQRQLLQDRPSRRPDCRRHHRRLRIRPRSRPRTRRVRTPPSASNGQARILLTAPDHRADRATQRHSLTTAS